ncbi:hypothetical protein GGR28_001636 [Lewinella aquimaris]|uniref:Uncharacterized protein n=1 Tax=Neolewinella aquimaris TaxID=1835722 RepID=A0A840EB54_9BACT|nr:hypothetical protein [Neolewinella aquimaris]MBB4079019.1 hypothetical protein [Neolewinella aquimaris]
MADRNVAQTVKHHVIADPSVVANGDFPGELGTYRRANYHTFPHRGSEASEQPPAPAVHELGRGAEQERFGDPPQLNDPGGPSPEAFRHTEFTQVLDAAGHSTQRLPAHG